MGLIPNIDILLPKFLYHFMHTVDLYEYSQATTVPSVRKSDVEQIALPLPPLPEQERIVSRIEELFSDLEAGVAALERVRAGLKRYKASVLKAAVSGKLVDGNLQVEEGVLPKGWRWVKLGELIRDGPTNGLYLPKSRYGVGIPILRIDDYQNGYSKSSGELRLVDATPNEVEKYGLREGDLIINRVNSPSHLGKCEIISKRNLPAIFESNMMRIRLSLERAEPNYIESYLQSVDGKSRLIRNAKWAVNQASINQQDVVSTLVPLPPLDEQRRIVAEVERRLSVVGEVESAVEAGLVRAGRLRQAVLRSAFEGRL
jgi:type I restriction enzyme S subunit